MSESWIEREERMLADALDRGEISPAEYNRELRELHRAYQGMAEDAAREAYDREMDRW